MGNLFSSRIPIPSNLCDKVYNDNNTNQQNPKVANNNVTEATIYPELQRLKLTLEIYKYTKRLPDCMSIVDLLNDYLFLQNIGQDNQAFAAMYEYFNQSCNINKCSLFEWRLHKTYDGVHTSTISDKAIYDIICKVHCYFLHSYDTGSRVNETDL
eukprot:307777_1